MPDSHGRNAWLWVFVGKGVCVYLIAAGRGFVRTAVVLRPGYDGVPVRDGWISYTKFALAMPRPVFPAFSAGHTRRSRREPITPPACPAQERSLLKDALALRDARTQKGLAPDNYVSGIESLATRRDQLLALDPPDAAEAHFLRHLLR